MVALKGKVLFHLDITTCFWRE